MIRRDVRVIVGRAVKVLVALMGAAVLTTGCTGADPGPLPAPTAAESTAVIETPDPAPTHAQESVEVTADPAPTRPSPKRPKRPPEMDGTDALAAMYTAEYFLDLYGYTVESGDTSLISELSGPNCGFCRNVIEATENIYSVGDWQTGGGFSRSESGLPDGYDGKEELTIVFDVTRKLAKRFNEDGEIVSSYESKKYKIGVNVGLVDGAWIIVSVDGEPR